MTLASESTSKGRARKPSAVPPAAQRTTTLERRRVGRYVLTQELGRGTTGVVYEARDTASNAVVALKTLVSTDPENLFRLKHEFRSLANLEHEGFVRFGELACEDGQWFFTMERIHGVDFLAHVRGGDPGDREGPQARLRPALAQLVEGLAALHEAGRIHRDVKPSNVLVTDEGRVVLLDFGLAMEFAADHRIAGTPAYMSPEQIACDPLTPAADWYAVGVMLYAALTGGLPFQGETPEILEAKLTGEAPSAREGWGEGLPQDLRGLCAALLAREPKERPDIDAIRGRLGLVALARASQREVFVGREAQLGRLREALVRAREGAAQVVVRGEPGVGKSALVERLLGQLPVETLVLRGRCYEQESVPFGGVDSLMDALSEHLLALDSRSADRLLAGGVSGIARLFPVLTRVPAVGDVRLEGPVPNPVALREQAFRELARLIAALGASRALVVYLDDLQWVDADSMALVRSVFLASDARCLFVATLRSDSRLSPEVSSFVEALEVIDVPRFSSEESKALWRALGPEAEDTLSDAALREADGHPMFLAELGRSAREGRLGAHANARLEDVLWERVSQRDPIERSFLEMAALAGAPTPYAVLAQAAGLDVGECATRLAVLRAAPMVRVSRVDDERCVEPYHDRLREAVMQRVREKGAAHVASMHRALGRALRAATPEGKLESRVFSIVQHLNAGRAQIASEAERRELAALNLTASQQAMSATAFDRARDYAIAGDECLPPDAASRDPVTWRNLMTARFTAEHVTGDRGAARAAFDATRAATPSLVERAAVYVRWISLEAGSYPHDAVKAGREILGELGVAAPASVTSRHVLAEYARTRWAQRGRAPRVFANAPRLDDPTTQIALEVLVAMVAAAYMCEANLMPWLMLRVAGISMSRGISEMSPCGLAGYGMTLTGAFGKHREAAEFGEVAVGLARADKHPNIEAKTELFFAGWLLPWVAPFAEAREGMWRAFETAKAAGDTEYAAYALLLTAQYAVTMGLDPRETLRDAQRTIEYPGAHRSATEAGTAYAGYARALLGETPSLTNVERSGDPDGALEASQTVEIVRYRHDIQRTELGYLAGEDVTLLERRLADVDRRNHMGFGAPVLADVALLHALVSARACDGASPAKRIRSVARIGRELMKLQGWARSCPANYEPYALLARAELLRVLGRAGAASAAFERAIASSKVHRSAKREAMACELAMRHARARGLHPEADAYRARAIDAYRRWGAVAKARALEEAAGTRA